MNRFHAIIPLTIFCLAAATLWLQEPAWAQEPARPQEIDYLRQIKPLLREKCYSCHGALEQESGLRLETRQLMLDGGDGGQVIVPGDASASELFRRITADDDWERMPPPEQGSAMTQDQIKLVRSWIDRGAQAPDEQAPPAPSEHWAFQPIMRPHIPSDARSPNPIDALLESKQRDRGLSAQPAGDRSILIRRLYLDLIGLPPTLQQLDDQRPWHEIVNELLASPHHGERWARHWMDIWRYCDWYGLGQQLRFSQKHMWHWRDWIVQSLNDNKGYDRMIMEMLAGDELAPLDHDAIAGTGYLARNYYLFNRTTWLDSTIEHTGKAFLGLTLNCAKCHDHKYDPISQLDYYRFRAIFEPHQVRLDPVPGVTDFEQDGLPRVFDDHVDIATYLHVRGDPKSPDTANPISAGVPAILESFATEVKPVQLPAAAFAPGSREYVQRDRLAQARAEIERAQADLFAAEQELAAMPPQQDPETEQVTPFALEERFDQPRPETWQVIGSGWQFRDSALHQTVATREPQMVRLRREVPDDFELECEYTTTGGTVFKSVTIRFDQSEDEKYSNYVYTSAHAPGPKVHVAYTRQGQSSYPPEGRRNKDIQVGKRYKLRFAIRDNLINVWLDDEFMVAYRYPDRRKGFLSLSAFDATAAFHSIKLRSLPSDFELTEATNKVVASVSDAEHAVEVARAKLAASEATHRAVEATIAADDARYSSHASDRERRDLADAAAGHQVRSRLAMAQYRLLADAADSKKVKAARDQIKTAQQQLTALKQGDRDAPEYESIRGAKKALESPAHKESDYPAAYSPTSTGRRLALARWIASPQNPLTARVAVNHVWLRHFGTPLVDSVFDFGLRAPKPVHVDVLDLLADEFINSGWSLQHLHRLIVTTDAYRRTASALSADKATVAADPENIFYWRMNSRRMESQLVRDSLLSLANQLDARLGGPSIDPAEDERRRSLYFKHSRDQQSLFLEMFDNADVLQCYRRSESIVPQQALALSNSKLSFEMSAEIERRISAAAAPAQPPEDRAAFIDSTFRLLLGRSATDEELSQCKQFFDQMAKIDDNPPAQVDSAQQQRRTRVRFVQSILNHNDFITIR